MIAKVSRNFGPLAEIPLSSAQLMREIGDFVVRLIRTRTEKGIDVRGVAFQPLSPSYAKQKQKHLGHSRADLTVSGGMLNDMGITQASARAVQIGFRTTGAGSSGGTFIQRSRSVGAADKAHFHNVTGAGRSGVTREFFDLTDGEIATVQTAVEKYLDGVL